MRNEREIEGDLISELQGQKAEEGPALNMHGIHCNCNCYVLHLKRSTYVENTGVTSGRGFLATLCRSVNSDGERSCTSHVIEGISPVSLSLSEGFILCGVECGREKCWIDSDW
jgi:hypothetical protein